MEFGWKEAEPREFVAKLAVALPRQDFKARLDAAVPAPGEQRRDFALLAAAQSDNLVEVRVGKMLRHHGDGGLTDVPEFNSNRVAGQASQHLDARDRVAVLDPQGAIDQVGGRQHIEPRHSTLPLRMVNVPRTISTSVPARPSYAACRRRRVPAGR